MCLIAIAYEAHPEYPLVVAANRDEYYDRQASQAHFWDEYPAVLAGRDLQAGGTWLGIDRHGRFGAITNFRSAGTNSDDAPSRGHLVSDFLCGRVPARAYLSRIATAAHRYNGFNLLLRDGGGLFYFSNRDSGSNAAPRKLEPGVYGLSNHLLDTPWPKVVQAKERFGRIIGSGQPLENLFDILKDSEPVPDHVLPETGIDTARERLLSSIFIASETYGTRCSTVLSLSTTHRARFIERSYDPGGVPSDSVEYRFTVSLKSAAQAKIRSAR